MPAGRLSLTGVVCAVLLAACAGQPTTIPGAGNWEEHGARLRQLTIWSAEGKLAVRTPQQSESASLLWRQYRGITRVQLNGPLGVAATTLYSDGKTLEIRRGDDFSSWDLADTRALERSTGWDLPLLALPYWLKGLPAPDLAIDQLQLGPDPALLELLEQDGWTIHYEHYDYFDSVALPTRLRIERSDTTVRVIIRDWQVTPG